MTWKQPGRSHFRNLIFIGDVWRHYHKLYFKSFVTADERITIRIDDVNDHEPTFQGRTYALDMPESMAVGSSVLTVVAYDADIGDNAKLIYTVLNSNLFYADSIFAARTGVIKIQQVSCVFNDSCIVFKEVFSNQMVHCCQMGAL